jgi:hypothetical protein
MPMFGPIPKREGKETTFTVHGQLWKLKCLGRDTWTLYNVRAAVPRCRFGNLPEITADLKAVLEIGVLPGKAGRP